MSRYSYLKKFRKKWNSNTPLQNYKHLKCIINIFNYTYLAHKFVEDFILIEVDTLLSRKFCKNCNCSVYYQALPQKNFISIISLNKYNACRILYDYMQ